MAKEKANVQAVVPPKIVRGKRGTQVPKEVLDTFAEVMATTSDDGEGGSIPSWASDRIAYETRAKANAAAMKVRKALVSTEGFKYTDVKQIQSRVWSGGEVNDKNEETAPFYFALAEREAAE